MHDKDDGTRAVQWVELVWSFLAAAKGEWPTTNASGMLVAGSRVGLLAGGFLLIVWGCKGDTEFHCNHFRIPGHWSSNFPCADCPADTSTSPMRWSNFKADAPWKVLGIAGNTERWLRHVAARGKNVHIISKAVADGGLGLGTEHLFRDTLHICCFGHFTAFAGQYFKGIMLHDDYLKCPDPCWQNERGVGTHYRQIQTTTNGVAI